MRQIRAQYQPGDGLRSRAGKSTGVARAEGVDDIRKAHHTGETRLAVELLWVGSPTFAGVARLPCSALSTLRMPMPRQRSFCPQLL